MNLKVLILYYSHDGAVEQLALQIARGVNSIKNTEAVVRQIKPISDELLENSAPYVEEKDLKECAGLAFCSPTYFGNMAAPVKHFLDSLTPLWFNGSLENKPATTFTSSGSMHGGNETTLLSMQIPLLHLGMVILGIPYSVDALKNTKSGGTPYGASHVHNPLGLSKEEKEIAFSQGKRLAETCQQLSK
jgi:NAD(P)H dehydrogenase (quinone)